MGPQLESLDFLPLLFTGVPPHGFGAASSAGGGTAGDSQLAQLWISAGGPAGMAHLMAAIAMAESTGRANAVGPRTPQGEAEGLWQILGALIPGNLLNPLVNARNAVAKWRAQGLGAWATYTSGAYRQFMSAGGPVSVFDQGGVISEPVWGVGASGRRYAFAQNGQTETVIPGAGGRTVVGAQFTGPVYMRDRTEAELVGQRGSWAVTKGSFG
jgi:hypothetical protein